MSNPLPSTRAIADLPSPGERETIKAVVCRGMFITGRESSFLAKLIANAIATHGKKTLLREYDQVAGQHA